MDNTNRRQPPSHINALGSPLSEQPRLAGRQRIVSGDIVDPGNHHLQDADEHTPIYPTFDYTDTHRPGHGIQRSVDDTHFPPPPLPSSHSTTFNPLLSSSQMSRDPSAASHTNPSNPQIRATDFGHPHFPEAQRYTTVPLNGPQGGAGEGYPPGEKMEDGAGTGSSGRGRKNRSSVFGVFGRTGSHATTGDPEKDASRPTNPRQNSWDRLRGPRDQSVDGAGGGSGSRTPRRAGAMTPEWEAFEFNPAHSKVETLRFAEGDVGKGKLSRTYFYLLSSSIVTRWILYILPIMALLWIPGIIWFTTHSAFVWSVPLHWWSIWLSIFWGGWWIALAVAMLLPKFVNVTLGSIVPSMKGWVDVAEALVRNVALIGWALGSWVSFTPVVINNFTGDQASNSRSNLTIMANLLFGIWLSSLVIGAEKLVVQLIAHGFHRTSYEDRIRDQKVQIRHLVTLYMNSHDIIGRSDTLTDASTVKKTHNPAKVVKSAFKGLRNVAQTTTTAFGNVVSEMAGQSTLQANSPYNKVITALLSANKTRALSRRLYYSYRKPGLDHVALEDVARFFPTLEDAQAAFAIFDRDDNGDATRDEIEMACLQIHREKLSLEASIADVTGAIKVLDSMFMFAVSLIVILIMAAMVTTKLTTLVTSAGAFLLALSFAIGTTLQEILLATIFLFVKHPYDIGDVVNIDGVSYVVSSMQLLSTTFKRIDGTWVFTGNNILATKIIHNYRRSGPISESFMFEVDFATSFEKLQALREKMLKFLKDEKRDYLPIFDVVVDDLPAQGKMNLKADIKFRTNWQEGGLKVVRRNKWICALKSALADCQIYGPAGAGDPSPPPPDPTPYTLIPYEVARPAVVETTESRTSVESPPPDFRTATSGGAAGASLLDRSQVINDPMGEIFGDDEPGSHHQSSSSTPIDRQAVRQRLPHPAVPGDQIEMTTPRRK